MWVASIAEAFLYFRLYAFDKIKVIPLEKVTSKVSMHRNFEKRISKSKYSNAGKELYATHVLYSEYEVRSNDATFYFTVESLNRTPEVKERIQATIDFADINTSFNNVIGKVAEVLGISESDIPYEFFEINIVGTNNQNIKLLGNHALREKSNNKSIILNSAADCERIKSIDGKMYLAYYIGSRLYARAGKYDKAVELTQVLIEVIGKKYPKLHLHLAYYYQMSGELNKAEKEISRLGAKKNLKYDVLWAKGILFEAKGDMYKAYKTFQNLKEIDAGNPDVYLHLAKTSMVIKKKDMTHGFVSRAAKLSGKPEGMVYFEIGNGFVAAKNYANAIEALRKCIDLMPDNAKAWQVLGNTQVEAGEDEKAALTYLHLFGLDYLTHQSYLEKASMIYEKLGKVEKAKEAYTSALEKYADPKVAILLATLEFKQGNYDRTKELLEPLGSSWKSGPKVRDMLEKCNRDRDAPIVTLIGVNPMVLDAGMEKYVDPGATAKDNEDGDLTNHIRVAGTVNVTRIDTYTVTYTVQDRAKNITKEIRKVIVIDTMPPVIKMTGGTTVNVTVGKKYKELGATARDNLDGDLTHKIAVSGTVHTGSPGVYVVSYTVEDALGNQSVAERLVNVRKPAKIKGDNTPPVITLTGGSPTTINAGDNFEEPSVNAVDAVDGDVTGFINIEGEVNPRRPGKYTLIYSATDRSGNKAMKILNVKVKKVKAEQVSHLTQLELLEKMERTYRRKKVISITTGILGAGSFLCGLVTNYMLLPNRVRYADEAGNQLLGYEEYENRKQIAQQTATLRDAFYAGAIIFTVGFTIDILIPFPRKSEE
jgi:tetratricopeptide (TPR) repeat protein